MIDPTRVFSSSRLKALWRCVRCSHEWRASFHSRANGRRCPACASKVLIPGRNDLESQKPLLAEAVRNIDPSTVFASSGKALEFDCSSCGDPFEEAPAFMTFPLCKSCRSMVSQGEAQLAEFVRSRRWGEVLTSNRSLIAPYELDIVVPERGFAIEFNGEWHHSDEVLLRSTGMSALERHSMKRDLARAAGLTLLFVWYRDWTRSREEVCTALSTYVETGAIAPLLDTLSKECAGEGENPFASGDSW